MEAGRFQGTEVNTSTSTKLGGPANNYYSSLNDNNSDLYERIWRYKRIDATIRETNNKAIGLFYQWRYCER